MFGVGRSLLGYGLEQLEAYTAPVEYMCHCANVCKCASRLSQPRAFRLLAGTSELLKSNRRLPVVISLGNQGRYDELLGSVFC
eukprot:6471023-Amphidinium_carterae.2